MLFEQEFENMLRQYSSCIEDKKKFTGLVKDFFPDQAKNANMLLMVYNMGIVDDIKKSGMINNTFAYRYVKQLIDDFGVSRVNADWIVSVWCVCYGEKILGKNCDISFQKQGSGPAITDEQEKSGKQYGDLFSYKKSSQGEGLGVIGFTGEKRDTIIFQNRSNNFNVIEICDNAFKNQSLEEAIITEGISFVGNNSFENCTRLHQVVLPISIKEIGDYAFSGCNGLKSISLPMQLEKIGNAAFQNCGLKTVSIPKSVYWIGKSAFSGCNEINNIIIPDNIDKIPESTFADCIGLKKVSLHEKLCEIGDKAFFGCVNLDFIIIPDSVVSIGDDAFTGTDKQFIIQCSFGSFAEQYCRKNKIKYQLV